MRNLYTVTFKTLGCKLNQAETASMMQQFIEHGYLVVEDTKADVSVINTCTVTGRSDAKCRQAIRQALHTDHRTTVIVTGCYPQVALDEILQIHGVDYIIGVEQKADIFKIFPGPGKKSSPVVHISPIRNHTKTEMPGHYTHTRAFLKIQNGCDNQCTYCIVPDARGPGYSVPIEAVTHQAVMLVQQGFKEIVLTGVHVGEYKSRRAGLPELLKRLMPIDGLERIRLTSLEPENVTETLLDVMDETKKICRHFHLSIQSGSEAVLKRMKRKSGLNAILDAIDRILNHFPDSGLGADIIVGFPGETESQFQETRELLNRYPFAYLHVFPFSKRPGTPAVGFPDQVPASTRIKRARELRTLGNKKSFLFRARWLHRSVQVLFENRNLSGMMSGHTSEYLRVEVPYRAEWVNQLVPVEITGMTRDCVQGIVHPSSAEIPPV